MSKKPELPAKFGQSLEKVGDPVSSSDLDTYARLQNVRDQSHRVRTIVNAWKKQRAHAGGAERRFNPRYIFPLA